MKSGWIITLISGCLCLSATAHTETSSHLKPGLWSVSVSASSHPDILATHKMCIDKTTERSLVAPMSETRPAGCSKYASQFTPAGATIDTVCTLDGGTSTTHRVLTYMGDTAYTMVLHGQRTQPGSPLYEDTLSEKGTWQGPCPPSMKPGDMTQLSVAPK